VKIFQGWGKASLPFSFFTNHFTLSFLNSQFSHDVQFLQTNSGLARTGYGMTESLYKANSCCLYVHCKVIFTFSYSTNRLLMKSRLIYFSYCHLLLFCDEINICLQG